MFRFFARGKSEAQSNRRRKEKKKPKPLFSREEIIAATDLVHAQVPPTAQFAWPLLSEAAGFDLILKHENHTPTGAFKVRGGVTFIDWLKRTHPDTPGIITATRGNHGQSQARAAAQAGMRCVIYVPEGNSREKNAAMSAFGGEVVTFGQDFDAAREEAMRVAERDGLFPVPPYHPELVRGVATYAYELFTTCPDLDTVYVPVGVGSGICGLITVRDALDLKTEIVGVVSAGAPAVKLSFDKQKLCTTDKAHTFADGMAVRVVSPEAFEIYAQGAARIVSVTDDEVAEAMRLVFRTTHNVAEGAGAASVAAALQEKDLNAGRKVGAILCGGNVDTDVFATVLSGKTPEP